MLSQKNIASNVYAMQLVENFLPTDVNLAFLPFHHIFGSTAMIVMLACGIATAFPDGLRYVQDNLKEYKVSVFVGVPLLVEAIYKKVEQGIEKKEIIAGDPKIIASENYGIIATSLAYKLRTGKEIKIMDLYKEFENTIIKGLKIN